MLSKRFAKIDQMRAGPAARLALRGLSYQAEYAKAWITTVHESGATPDVYALSHGLMLTLCLGNALDVYAALHLLEGPAQVESN